MRLTLLENSKEIFIQDFNNREELAGCAAVGVGIIRKLNERGATKHTVDGYELVKGNTWALKLDTDVSDYRLLSGVDTDNIIWETSRNFGVWIESSVRFQYDLYVFDTAEFMKGIVSMCASFEDDFRNYIFMLPFDRLNRGCIMQGYHMNDATTYIMLSKEFNDTDEERADDENVLAPLANQVNYNPVYDDIALETYLNPL